jgi:hypothetical protein
VSHIDNFDPQVELEALLNPPTRRQVRLTPASAIKPRRQPWLWAGKLPLGELALTVGRGAVGKSCFHARVISDITHGRLQGDLFGTPRACAIASTEDSWEHTIVPRLIVSGANLDMVYRLSTVTEEGVDVSISLPADLPSLESVIFEHRIALVSVDPLLGVVGDSIDSHKDAEVRRALQPLVDVAHTTGCSILGNAHFTKSSAGTVDGIMGSAAFGNVPRSVLAFVKDVEAGHCTMTQIKNNLGPEDAAGWNYLIIAGYYDTDEGETLATGQFAWLSKGH